MFTYLISKVRHSLGFEAQNRPAANQLIIQDLDDDVDDIEAQDNLAEDDDLSETIPLLSVVAEQPVPAEEVPLDLMAQNLKFTPYEDKLLRHKDEIMSANCLLLSLHSEKFKKAALGITPIAALGGYIYGLCRAFSWFSSAQLNYDLYLSHMNTQSVNWQDQTVVNNVTCSQTFGQGWNIVSGSTFNSSANYCIQNPYNNTDSYDPNSPFAEICLPIFNAYCKALSEKDEYEKDDRVDIMVISFYSFFILAFLACSPFIKTIIKTDRMGPQDISTLVPAEQLDILNDILLVFDVDFTDQTQTHTLNDMIREFALLLRALQTLDENINEKRDYNKARRDAFFEVATRQDIQVDKRRGSPLFCFFKQDNCLTLTNKILDMAGLSNDFEADLKKYNKPEISEVSDEEAEKILKRNLL